MKSLDRLIADLAPEDRASVEIRSRELIAEELTLRELRKAQRMSQKTLAQTLRMGQDSVSRLERRSDMLLSTLQSYVEAMGGSLKLTVEFPGSGPVALAGLSSDILAVAETRRQPLVLAPSKGGAPIAESLCTPTASRRPVSTPRILRRPATQAHADHD